MKKFILGFCSLALALNITACGSNNELAPLPMQNLSIEEVNSINICAANTLVQKYQAFGEKAFVFYDKDKNKKVEHTEYVNGNNVLASKMGSIDPSMVEDIKKDDFNEIDLNRDGVILPTEMKKYCNTKGKELMVEINPQIDQMFAMFDSNSDGKVSADEASMMLEGPKFQEADKNKDGFLNKQEVGDSLVMPILSGALDILLDILGSTLTNKNSAAKIALSPASKNALTISKNLAKLRKAKNR